MHTIQSTILPGRSRVSLRPSRDFNGRRVIGWFVAAWNTLLVWQARANQRHQLTQLEPHRLEDMGLTPRDVAKETAKPFWRA